MAKPTQKSAPIRRLRARFVFASTLVLVLLAGLQPRPAPVIAQETPARTIYAPRFDGDIELTRGAIAWFGQVTQQSNYADIRVAYNADMLVVGVHIFDAQLWYNPAAQGGEALAEWDAVSLFLDTTGAPASGPPTASSRRLLVQLRHFQDAANYQAAWQGSGSGWSPTPFAFTAVTAWRGSDLNAGGEERGWNALFRIPYAALGLAGPPSQGAQWRMGLVLHDRDSAAGTGIPDQRWPETLDPDAPATWGRLHFGPASYAAPELPAAETVLIRHGLNGATVVDAAVGGHSTCGEAVATDFFGGWGALNYAGYTQVSIQNQWDVADWPCFSKFYVTFPLDALPAEGAVLSANVTLHLFGTAGGGEWGEPPVSYIQALTVAEDWDEATLTWNNAPLAGGKGGHGTRRAPGRRSRLAGSPGHLGCERRSGRGQSRRAAPAAGLLFG